MKKKQVTQELSPCKVVVIDDEQKEVLALIRSLGERSIPVLYYSGKKDELPKTPLTGVRIVFLDLLLEGMQGQPSKTIVSHLMGTLKTVISDRNGPYIILAWTKHDLLLENFQCELEKTGTEISKPCFLVDMEKSECIIDEEADYGKVQSKLTEILGDLYVFDFLVTWEKTIDNSSSDVVNLINSMSTKSDKAGWTGELEKILYNMAKAHSGEQLGEDLDKITDSAAKVLNGLLKDFVEKNVSAKGMLKKPSGDLTISDKTKAITNTIIHVRTLENPSANSAPGNLYIVDFPTLKKFFEYLPTDEKEFKEPFFKQDSNLDTIKLCMLEITPICDYTNKKWKCNRLLIGLIVPKAMKNKIKSADFLYQTPLLYLDDAQCYVVFSFHYMTEIKFKKLASLGSKYQFRMDLLSYIQSKMSNHITRRGIFSI